VLGINLCFYDRNGSKFEEPIFIAANTRYQLGIPDDKFKRGWDAHGHHAVIACMSGFQAGAQEAVRRGQYHLWFA
jgi:hypothetical protein